MICHCIACMYLRVSHIQAIQGVNVLITIHVCWVERYPVQTVSNSAEIIDFKISRQKTYASFACPWVRSGRRSAVIDVLKAADKMFYIELSQKISDNATHVFCYFLRICAELSGLGHMFQQISQL